MDKPPINPMHKAHAAPRCLATTRKGTACQSPAVKGRKRCRMHGGTNPGAPKGNQNARKHGGYSAKTLEAVQVFAPEQVNRLAKLKKAEMASEAERLAAGTGWLPVMFQKAAVPVVAEVPAAPETVAGSDASDDTEVEDHEDAHAVA